VVRVSHKPNIMDAFGKDCRLVVRVKAADWAKLAQQAAN
jgi:hypothetical protein